MADSTPPKKVGSLKDRIAQFEHKPAVPAAPRPPPKTPTQWAFKQRQSDASHAPSLTPSIKSVDQSIASSSSGEVETQDPPTPEKKPSGMSTSDAKASIAQGGSLKDRMAALQNKGAFGAPAVAPPLPPSEGKPRVWKKPVVPASDVVEAAVPIQIVPVSHDPEAHDHSADISHAEGEQEAETPEEEERQRRAAIAARMARLGGARLGMGPPVFAKPPAVVRRETEEVKEETHPDHPKVSEPQSDIKQTPPASVRRNSTESKENVALPEHYEHEVDETELVDHRSDVEQDSSSIHLEATNESEVHEPPEDSHSRPASPADGSPPSPPREAQPLTRSLSTTSQGDGEGEGRDASDDEKPPVPPKDEDEMSIKRKSPSLRSVSRPEQGFPQSPTSEGIPTGTLNEDDDAQRELGIRVIQGEGRPGFRPEPDDPNDPSIRSSQSQESLAVPPAHQSTSRPTSATMPLPAAPKRVGPPRKRKVVKSIASEMQHDAQGNSQEQAEEAVLLTEEAPSVVLEAPSTVPREEKGQEEKHDVDEERAIDVAVPTFLDPVVPASKTPASSEAYLQDSETIPTVTSDMISPTSNLVERPKGVKVDEHGTLAAGDMVESGESKVKRDVSESETFSMEREKTMEPHTYETLALSKPFKESQSKRKKRTKSSKRSHADTSEGFQPIPYAELSASVPADLADDQGQGDHVQAKAEAVPWHTPDGSRPLEPAARFHLIGETYTPHQPLEPEPEPDQPGSREPLATPPSGAFGITRKLSVEVSEYPKEANAFNDQGTPNRPHHKQHQQITPPPVPPASTRPVRRTFPAPLQPLRTTEAKSSDTYLSPSLPPLTAHSLRSPIRSLPPPPPPDKSDEAFIEEVQQHNFPTRIPTPPPIHVSSDIQDMARTSVEFYHGKEYMDEGDTDPIDPSFYSPARSTVSLPESPKEPYSTSPVDNETLLQAEEQNTEVPDLDRRRELASRMAKLGGVKLGVSTAPTRQATAPVSNSGWVDDAEQEGSQEGATDELVQERRAAIAARLAAGGGKRLGLFPESAHPRSIATAHIEHDDEVADYPTEPDIDSHTKDTVRVQTDPSSYPEEDQGIEREQPKEEGVPPPLPPGRPSSLTRPSRLPPPPPPPPPPPEKDSPMIGQPTPSDPNPSQDVVVPTYIQALPRSPFPRPSRAPPIPIPDHHPQVHHTARPLPEPTGVGVPPEPMYNFEELPPLEIAHMIAQAAASLQEQSKTAVIGDGTPSGFVNIVLKRVPVAAPISFHTGQFGHLIYSQEAHAVLLRTSEIVPGDILALTNVRFKGTKSNFQRYETSIDTQGGPLLAIIHEVDHKRQKIRAMHPCLTKDIRPSIEIASYRLEDLKTGSIQIYRAAIFRAS